MRFPFAAYHILLALLMLACHRESDGIDGLAFQSEADGRWGIMAPDGHTLVPPLFDRQPSTTVNGMFSLPDDEGFRQLYALADPGRPVNKQRYRSIGHFFEEVTWAQTSSDTPFQLINRQGECIASTESLHTYHIALVHNFYDGRALFVTTQGKYGYLDTQGEVAIPPIYDCAFDFHEGTALVGMENAKGQLGFQTISTEGHVRMAIQLSDCMLDQQVGDGRLQYKEHGNGVCGYLDDKGKSTICLPASIRQSGTYRHDIALIETSTGLGAIDKQGNILLPPLYADGFVAAHDRMAMLQSGRWQLFASTGEVVTGESWHSISPFTTHGTAVVQTAEGCNLIDVQGAARLTEPMHRIVIDSTALRLSPQRFVRKSALAIPRRAQEEKAPTPSTTPQPTPQRRTSLAATDWREVGKQSPFYAEAQKVLSGQLDESDVYRRELILNYMEHLRTSYTTKDIDFLEQLFSEHALIVVGHVVRTASATEGNYLSPQQVVFNVKSKREYLDRLKQVFAANQKIDLKFSQFHIMRHPTHPGIYGVSLRQGYSSDSYSDDGYLFLLWDFTDETAPQIHVRTWQPRMTADGTPLSADEAFTIRDFNLQ